MAIGDMRTHGKKFRTAHFLDRLDEDEKEAWRVETSLVALTPADQRSRVPAIFMAHLNGGIPEGIQQYCDRLQVIVTYGNDEYRPNYRPRE